MKSSRFCLLFCCAACAVALAQDRRTTHPDDANGDGRISRSEWRGSAAEFQQRDSNRDGFLSGTEIPSDRQNTVDQRSGRSQGNAEMRQLDKNANGAVEGYEWPYNSDVFHRLDTDGNSVLTADELRNLSSVAQQELDRNPQDSRPNSRRSTYAEFDRLDTNRDGRVTAEEYSRSGADWQRRQRFDEWDTNRNGVIDSSEWNAAPQLFRRLDANRDSRVTWEEFRADTERYRPPYNWR